MIDAPPELEFICNEVNRRIKKWKQLILEEQQIKAQLERKEKQTKDELIGIQVYLNNLILEQVSNLNISSESVFVQRQQISQQV